MRIHNVGNKRTSGTTVPRILGLKISPGDSQKSEGFKTSRHSSVGLQIMVSRVDHLWRVDLTP